MKSAGFKNIFLTVALAAAALSGKMAQATPVVFTGSYSQNFDQALTNGSAAMIPGFRSLVLPGGNGTFTASNPVGPDDIAGATVSSSQTLLVWDAGTAVTASSFSLFNIGRFESLSNRALGTDPGSSSAANVIELSMTNGTGSSVFGVTINYNALCLSNGSAGTEADELPGYSFFYSLTGSASAADWTRVDALSLANYTQGTVSNSGDVNITFATPLLRNAVIYFRWADDNNQANNPDQMLAIDDLSISTYTPPGLNVILLTPTNNASYVPPATISLTERFSDTVGTVTNIIYYNGTNVITNATGAPFGRTWANVPAGNYAIYAVAYDDHGLRDTSDVSSVTVAVPQTAPTVSLTSPTNGATYDYPAVITFSATAASSSGGVTNVAFYRNSILIANVATAPYNYVWSNALPNNFILTAVATDNTGVSTVSSLVNITVANLNALKTIRQIKTVFIIALENHDWTQSSPQSNPQQVFGNPAAPYINSLATPGNPNAAQTAYATRYFNVAHGEHPSEPNYIWAEAGTDFGSHTSSDPNPAAGNVFTNVMHLSAQLTTAGIPWRNYQEDVEYSSSPLVSASGSTARVNAYNGTTQYDYAPKHNPMVFFTDTQTNFCYPLTNFWSDLTNNNIGRYNWITPDQCNEMHSALPGGYTYHGTTFTGDQAAIAEGDNALSIIVPKIMASAAYQDHGVIIIRTDETESTDDTNSTLPFVIISPLAKGNAYNSTAAYSHSSVLKTMDELFGLAFQTNAIPANNVNAFGNSYNYVDGRSLSINDLSDFFRAPGLLINVPNTITVEATNVAGNVVSFNVTVTDNTGSNNGPVTLAVSPASGSVFPLGTNVVTATATNAPGFSATNTFQVIVRDTTPPVITINGANPLTNSPGVAFVDPGATAYDLVSGAVPVTTNGNVNVNTPGTYNVLYTASDAAGNVATSSRLVRVISPVPFADFNGTILTDGSFQLAFSYTNGQPYRIIGSTNLAKPITNWTVVTSGTVTNNPVIFTDPGSLTNTYRFYRVVSP
ncbi:MAG TPA: Ig-like domain-containing protein [Verrucomicrobiae bacterium]|nr:Ig-like domain-containing protein [Verrucomicrobiae bacterium]